MSFLLSIPGMIGSALLSFVGIVSALVGNVGSICTNIIELFSRAQNFLDPVIDFIRSNEYFSFFYHLVALDAFVESFSTFISIVIAIIVLSLFEVFFQCVVVAVPFFIYKGVSKIVQASSAGFVKPA